jgi:cellulose synthase/poly-beta-1,6-N-acetylglucosamine synthase-like glycosyltransferase
MRAMPSGRSRRAIITSGTLRAVFWLSAGALAWTHVGYPLAAAALARRRPRPVRQADLSPRVTVVVAAHNEEGVIGRRVVNLLELDYPHDRLDVVVASDGSEDATWQEVQALAAADTRVRVADRPRAGKVAAQDAAVAETTSEIVCFSDANSIWARDALRKLVRNFADPEVGYVCGRLELERPDGTSREPLYWRYELWIRENESRLGSITGGNGAIYAVRREDYRESDPRLGHDLGFPYVMAQNGRRAVYDPEALAFEKAARDSEDELGRRVRMQSQSWLHILSGRMLRPAQPLFLAQLVSHRVLRNSTGVLHIALFGASAALERRKPVYRRALAAQVAWLALAAAGRLRVPLPGAALAYYYLAMTGATVAGLVRCLRGDVPAVWDKAAGTR